jgi:hypothetical protein
MLRKCLKYNYKATTKLWVIASVIVSVAVLIAAFAVRTLNEAEWNNRTSPLLILAVFSVMLGIIAASAYVIISLIMGPARMYKSCFTDEGYLTFTLPVSRTTLFNASLIHGLSVSFSSVLVLLLDLTVFLAIVPNSKDGPSVLVEMLKYISSSFADIPPDAALALIQLLIALIAYYVFLVVLIYTCLVVGCVLVKKARLLMSIGVYALTSVTLTGLYYILILAGTTSAFAISSTESQLLDDASGAIVNLILLGVISFFVVLSSLMYSFSLGRLKHSLNLS